MKGEDSQYIVVVLYSGDWKREREVAMIVQGGAQTSVTLGVRPRGTELGGRCFAGGVGTKLSLLELIIIRSGSARSHRHPGSVHPTFPRFFFLMLVLNPIDVVALITTFTFFFFLTLQRPHNPLLSLRLLFQRQFLITPQREGNFQSRNLRPTSLIHHLRNSGLISNEQYPPSKRESFESGT